MAMQNLGQSNPQAGDNKLLRKMGRSGKKENLVLIIGAILVVLAGVGTGWLLSGKKSTSKKVTQGATQSQNEAGITDESTFKDTAEGVLEEGGIQGEGTHHLRRDSDSGQYVYLTSTVIDLQSFVGKKVQVWGETVQGKKAGWLMDVGKIKVID
jgi:hypothetical protein